MAPRGPRKLQEAPKMVPKMAPRWPKMAEDDPKMAQDLLGNETESEGRIADRSRLDVKW